MEISENTEDIDFKLHDFGARSATSLDSAALGGMAHLVNFRGSDTIAGLVAARRYYDAEMAGYSIPAADHSTITAWGVEDELEAYRNMLNQFSKDNVIAIVSDSYNILEALDKLWGEQLKQEIEDFGGKVIIRLDSGNPVQGVPEAIEILMSKFCYTINSKGYKVLPSYIRVIQGDGISIGSIENILIAMKSMQQSAENVAFGMGSALLQKVDRDTMSFAMKASAIYNSGIWHDMYKNPKFDPDKRSKAGRFALVTNQDGTVETIKLEDLGTRENMLKVVFENGALLNDVSFDSIRNRVARFQR